MEFFIQGVLLQASLILALGAQNIFVLDAGLKRQHYALVALICTTCDVVLIFTGVAGAASIFLDNPELKVIFGFLGVGFLGFYALLKLKQAFYRSSVTEYFL